MVSAQFVPIRRAPAPHITRATEIGGSEPLELDAFLSRLIGYSNLLEAYLKQVRAQGGMAEGEEGIITLAADHTDNLQKLRDLVVRASPRA